MKITPELVDYIAHLARIELTDDERKLYRVQLESILDYIDKLNELDTSGIEPMIHTLRITNVFRADAVKPSLPTDQALRNAPNRTEDSYKVPAVIE